MNTDQKRILITSDDPVGIQVLQYMHDHLGYIADPVQSAEEARLQLQGERYSLMYVDLYHPPQSGSTLIHTVRNGECGRHNRRLPIITVADYPSDIRCIDQMRAGADALLCKPVYLDHLKLLLKKFFREQPKQRNRGTTTADIVGRLGRLTAQL